MCRSYLNEILFEIYGGLIARIQLFESILTICWNKCIEKELIIAKLLFSAIIRIIQLENIFHDVKWLYKFNWERRNLSSFPYYDYIERELCNLEISRLTSQRDFEISRNQSWKLQTVSSSNFSIADCSKAFGTWISRSFGFLNLEANNFEASSNLKIFTLSPLANRSIAIAHEYRYVKERK